MSLPRVRGDPLYPRPAPLSTLIERKLQNQNINMLRVPRYRSCPARYTRYRASSLTCSTGQQALPGVGRSGPWNDSLMGWRSPTPYPTTSKCTMVPVRHAARDTGWQTVHIIVFSTRKCAAWVSTLITHKHSRKKKTTGNQNKKETYAQRLTPFYTYFRLTVSCSLHSSLSPTLKS